MTVHFEKKVIHTLHTKFDIALLINTFQRGSVALANTFNFDFTGP